MVHSLSLLYPHTTILLLCLCASVLSVSCCLQGSRFPLASPPGVSVNVYFILIQLLTTVCLQAKHPINNSLPSHQCIKLPYVLSFFLAGLVANLYYRTLLAVSRSPFVSILEQSLFVATRSRLSSLSGNFPSNVLFVRLHKISRYAQSVKKPHLLTFFLY